MVGHTHIGHKRTETVACKYTSARFLWCKQGCNSSMRCFAIEFRRVLATRKQTCRICFSRVVTCWEKLCTNRKRAVGRRFCSWKIPPICIRKAIRNGTQWSQTIRVYLEEAVKQNSSPPPTTNAPAAAVWFDYSLCSRRIHVYGRRSRSGCALLTSPTCLSPPPV